MKICLHLQSISSPHTPFAPTSTYWRTRCLVGSTAGFSNPTRCLSSTFSDACLASSRLFARFSNPPPCSERYLTLFRCTSTAESYVSSEPTWADSVWQSWSSRRECSSPAPPSSPPPPPCTSACSPWEPGSTINITWPSSLQRFPRS